MFAHRAAPHALRRTILIVDDEVALLRSAEAWLAEAGWSSVCVPTFVEALAAARSDHFDLAVVDYRLKEGYEGIRLGQVLLREYRLPFILVSGYLNTPVIVEAMKSGAVEVIDKPLSPERLLEAIRRSADTLAAVTMLPRLIGESGKGAAVFDHRSPTDRWSRMVLSACDCVGDPRTVPIWARGIGVSASTIEEICRLCDVTARDSRDLGRFLRALALSRACDTPLRSHFSVADERTFQSLFSRAGLVRDAGVVPLKALLLGQTFVPQSKSCFREFAHLAANSALFF